jgi:hypothetical protein
MPARRAIRLIASSSSSFLAMLSPISFVPVPGRDCTALSQKGHRPERQSSSPRSVSPLGNMAIAVQVGGNMRQIFEKQSPMRAAIRNRSRAISLCACVNRRSNFRPDKK